MTCIAILSCYVHTSCVAELTWRTNRTFTHSFLSNQSVVVACRAVNWINEACFTILTSRTNKRLSHSSSGAIVHFRAGQASDLQNIRLISSSYTNFSNTCSFRALMTSRTGVGSGLVCFRTCLAEISSCA